MYWMESRVKTILLAALLMIAAAGRLAAQGDAAKAGAAKTAVAMADTARIEAAKADSIAVPAAVASGIPADSVFADSISRQIALAVDSTAGKGKQRRDWTSWRPDPQRALWLALVIPGGGQIYNRKYWKLPLVYGGIIGCLYAMSWNNSQYKDYSQAYLDLMDDDPGTASYNRFLHLGVQIDASNEQRYQEIFKNRKDKYRRWRDLSFFVLIGVYALSVIDAYVDAELSTFDISKDLSLKIEPAVLDNRSSRNPISSSSLGLQCKFNF